MQGIVCSELCEKKDAVSVALFRKRDGSERSGSMNFVVRTETGTEQNRENHFEVHVYCLLEGEATCEAFLSSMKLIPNTCLVFPQSVPHRFLLKKGSKALYFGCDAAFLKRLNQIPMLKTNFYYWISNAGTRHQNCVMLSGEQTKRLAGNAAEFDNISAERCFLTALEILTVVTGGIQKLSLYNCSQVESILTEQVLYYIEEHLNDKFTLEEIAGSHYVSVSSLRRSFQREVHLPLKTYVLYRRLEEARRWMIYGNSLVTAFERSGFTEYSNFSNAFKSVFGLAPKYYCQRFFGERTEDYESN